MRPTVKSGNRKGKKMKSRAEVKEMFKAWGIEEPTDEQITEYLNGVAKEVKAADDRANKYKADADKVKDLEKQLEELNSQNLTDVEKANKATEDALKQVAELQKTVSQMQLAKSLAEIGIIGDEAAGLVGEDGNLNTELLGKIIEGREKSAVAAFQKQALDSTPAPDDKKGSEDDPSEPYKDIVDRVVASKKAETDAVGIIDSYK